MRQRGKIEVSNRLAKAMMFILDCVFTTFLSLVFSYFISILISLDSRNNESQHQVKLNDYTDLNSESKANEEEELINKTESFQTTANEPDAKLTPASQKIEQDCCNDEVIKSDIAFRFENVSENLNLSTKDDGQASREAEISEDKVDVRKEVDDLLSEDDDEGWEGIERTDLEKRFSKAVKFVKSCHSIAGFLPKTDDDLKMKFYGLHKLATEGHCCVSQPMAFKLSARAKWTAWNQLGKMSPDSAMERYMILLSEHFPQWMVNDDLEMYAN